MVMKTLDGAEHQSSYNQEAGVTARYAAMPQAGIAPPVATGLGLDEAAGMIDPAERQAFHESMMQRLATREIWGISR